MNQSITPDIRNAVLVLLRASADRMDRVMPNGVDSIPQMINHIVHACDEYCLENFTVKNEITFEQMRDTMDENQIIEAAQTLYECNDAQPILTGFNEWVERAKTKSLEK